LHSSNQSKQKLFNLIPSNSAKMVRYMVAVDGSNNAKAAFYTALFMMNKETDELIILHVVERIKGYPTFVPHHTLKAWQNDTNLTGKAVLTSFARLARAQVLLSCVFVANC
jgi:hypothetical protein